MVFAARSAGLFLWVACTVLAAAYPDPKPGEVAFRDFHFSGGEVLPSLKLHYFTLGTPARNADGQIVNAVLLLHGTGGRAVGFFTPTFAGELFGSGQPLDATRWFIIVPDNIGHGGSSKPSDGLHAKFPHYDYDDMIAAQHLLLTDGLHVNHLRLVMGTSMGCMHSWVWLETYPDFMDASMPLACLPVQIAGRNRMWRKMVLDAVRLSPDYNNGDYTQQPVGLRTALDFL